MPLTQQEIDNLQRIVDEKLKKMFDDKKEIPKLLIPKQLPSFVKSKTFIGFLIAVSQYCINFNQLLKQYQQLREKMMSRVSDEASLLKKEKESLAKLEREVSYHYSAIIISFNTQCLQEERYRSNYKDQVFFESLIYLVERVMKEMFAREDFLLIQEEINRLFRTNRYNLIKKRHENDEVLHKYPALKDFKNTSNLTNILTKAPERISAYKKHEKDKKNKSSYDYTKTLGLPQEPNSADMEQRSPLLCTWLPSRKSMLDDFSQISSYNNYLSAQKPRNSLESGNSEDGRSRMASLGNNVMNSN